MFKLAETTRPDWLGEALAHLDVVMLDHAHCEKKAAGAALRLLFAYPQIRVLQQPLAALAREELLHFSQVLRVMERLGFPFTRQRPSAYAGKLNASARKGEPARLVDLLLICGLIEARSFERLALLGEAPLDAELTRFYGELARSEERHVQVYFNLAQQVADEAGIDDRLQELSQVEAAILREPAQAPRFHS